MHPPRPIQRWRGPFGPLVFAVALLLGCRGEAPVEGSGSAPSAGLPPLTGSAPAAGEGSGAATPTPAEVAAASPEGSATGAGPTGEAEGTAEAAPPTLDELRLDLGAMTLDPELERYVVPVDNGLRAVLTLDPGLQDHLSGVVHRYDEPAEAVVALEPSTGRVLAWVEDHNELVAGDHPAASAEPWAASLFKMVSATILIEERNLGLARQMCVPPGRGEIDEADLVFDEARDTLCVDFTEAMAESVNLFFGRLFVDELTPEVVDAWLLRLGFNQPIPFELEVGQSEASVPASHLERARMGAGFRHSHLSPLHAALIAATIANGGVMMRPTLVDRLIDADGEVVAQRAPEVWRRVFAPETARTLTQALSATTVTGTAARYFAQREGWPHDLLVAGKTGTLSNRPLQGPDPDPVLTYSWFAGFAPAEAPRIAVAALVYNTERWYIKGSYLASEAIVQYLAR